MRNYFKTEGTLVGLGFLGLCPWRAVFTKLASACDKTKKTVDPYFLTFLKLL
jgi:hypothetical protein